MKRSNSIIRGSQVAAGVALALGAQTGWAADAYLRACEYIKELPTATGTAPVTMWGYEVHPDAASAAAATGCAAGAPPVIRVPAADAGSLTIHLHNALPAGRNYTTASSVYLSGQPRSLSPVRWDDADPDYGGRVRSLDVEVLPGTSGDYTWTSMRPGTYLFHSGTHPQVQVQMGLYGAVVVETAGGEAYAGLTPTHEATLVYSEVDPAVHAAVGANDYGPGASMTSTVNYAPRWFLINGAPYTTATPNTITASGGGIRAGDEVLLRLVNAGLESHALQILHGEMEVIAEDGHLKPSSTPSSSALLAAGKTLDAVFVPPAGGNYPLYDRSLRLVNDTGTPGGMFASIQVGGPGYQHPPVARPDVFMLATNALSVPNNNNYSATFNDAGLQGTGLLANDYDVDANGLFVLRVIGHTPDPILNNANSVTWDNPIGAAGGRMDVRRDGRVRFRAPATDWVGLASFDYQARDNTAPAPPGLTSAVTPALVVHDLYSATRVYHNRSAALNNSGNADYWTFTGTLRGMSATGVADVLVSLTGGSDGTCPLNGTIVASHPVTLGPSVVNWSYDGRVTPPVPGLANDLPTNCNRVRVEVALPAADGVPAHTVTYGDLNVTRQNENTLSLP